MHRLVSDRIYGKVSSNPPKPAKNFAMTAGTRSGHRGEFVRGEQKDPRDEMRASRAFTK